MFDYFIHAMTVATLLVWEVSAYCGGLERAWRLAPAVNNLMKNCIVPEDGFQDSRTFDTRGTLRDMGFWFWSFSTVSAGPFVLKLLLKILDLIFYPLRTALNLVEL